jgi:hypothetical protein
MHACLHRSVAPFGRQRGATLLPKIPTMTRNWQRATQDRPTPPTRLIRSMCASSLRRARLASLARQHSDREVAEGDSKRAEWRGRVWKNLARARALPKGAPSRLGPPSLLDYGHCTALPAKELALRSRKGEKVRGRLGFPLGLGQVRGPDECDQALDILDDSQSPGFRQVRHCFRGGGGHWRKKAQCIAPYRRARGFVSCPTLVICFLQPIEPSALSACASPSSSPSLLVIIPIGCCARGNICLSWSDNVV